MKIRFDKYLWAIGVHKHEGTWVIVLPMTMVFLGEVEDEHEHTPKEVETIIKNLESLTPRQLTTEEVSMRSTGA